MKRIKINNGDVIHGFKILQTQLPEDKRKCLFICPICLKEKISWRGVILSGKKKSCGCNRFHKREWKSHQFKDLSGTIFGDLVVIQRDFSKKERVNFLCRCKCGNVKSIFSHYLTSGKSTTCGCSKHFIGEKSNSWKGCGDITGHYFAHIRGQAKSRNLIFNITIEQLWDLFLKQNKKCQLSGLDLDLFPNKTSIRTASLDRIDSSKGYTIDNVQWVHKDVNYMKRTLNMEKFIMYCHLISKKYAKT